MGAGTNPAILISTSAELAARAVSSIIDSRSTTMTFAAEFARVSSG